MATKRRRASPVAEIQDDLYALREDIGHLADQVTELLSDKGDEVVSDVKQRVSQIRKSIDGAISEAGARGREAVGDVKDRADALGERVEESLREPPFTMLALAVGLGMFIGTTWRR
ncbi:MAG: DUF883 family protein [Xanthobacteraceae bacterium]